MKTPIKTMMLLLFAITVTSVFATPDDRAGNGGGAHLCKNPDGSFKSIESFDLFEGRIRGNLDIPAWDGKTTKEEYLNKALEKISATYRQVGFADALRAVLKKMATPGFIRNASGIVLQPVDDSNQYFVGEGCEYRQIVNWIDYSPITGGDEVLRDETNYKKMDPLSQASLDLHEAMYKVVRFYNVDPLWPMMYLPNPRFPLKSTEGIRNQVAKTFATKVEYYYEMLRPRWIDEDIVRFVWGKQNVRGDRGIGDDGGPASDTGNYRVIFNTRDPKCDTSQLSVFLSLNEDARSSSDADNLTVEWTPPCPEGETKPCTAKNQATLSRGSELKIPALSFGTWSNNTTIETKITSQVYVKRTKDEPYAFYILDVRVEGCGIKSRKIELQYSSVLTNGRYVETGEIWFDMRVVKYEY